MRILLLSTLFLFVFTLVPVYGAEATPSSKREAAQERLMQKRETVERRVEEKREMIQQRIEEQKERAASKAAEIRRRLTERRRAIVRRHFARVLRRFEAAVTRMERIADRTESRLDKMEDRGLDISSLRDDLALVRSDLEVAERLLGGLDAEVEEALSAEDPKEAFGVVRDTFLEVKELLKDIHQELVSIIRAMKSALEAEASNEATSSASE